MVVGQMMKQDSKFRQQYRRLERHYRLKVIMPRIPLQMSYALVITRLFCEPLHFVTLYNPFRSSYDSNERHGNFVAERGLRQGFVARHVCADKVLRVAATQVAQLA